jgi:hypothetical protein
LIGYGGANRIIEVNKANQITWECNMYRYDADSAHYKPLVNYRCSNAKYLHGLAVAVAYQRNTKIASIKNIGASNEFEFTVYQKDGFTEIVKINRQIAEKSSFDIDLSKYQNMAYIQVKTKTNKSYIKLFSIE